MAKKKKRQISDVQFKLTLVVIVALVVALFYFALLQDRFTVHEESLVKEPLLTDYLSYNTEFCAQRLTDLAHEAHFLEQTIALEREMLSHEVRLSNGQDVLTVEQRELSEVKKEFTAYRELCDTFDQNPTQEICSQFLLESKEQLDAAQSQVQASSGVERLELKIKELRQAKRIHAHLQDVCSTVK